MDEQRHGLISGRYRLGELLGSGGSASVFVATDVVTHSTVALKILHPHLSTVAPRRQAMLDIAHCAMSVRHVNVAEVLGSGIDSTGAEPLAWIAMELAPGVSVAELVERDGPMGVDQALAMAEGVLNALEASHAAGRYADRRTRRPVPGGRIALHGAHRSPAIHPRHSRRRSGGAPRGPAARALCRAARAVAFDRPAHGKGDDEAPG